MAGVPAVVKPGTNSFLTQAVVRTIIESGILPEGSLQLIAGSARTILDDVQSQDVVSFTGSAKQEGCQSSSAIIEESVPFTKTDSLNASILGPDAKPGTPELTCLFVR